MVPEEKVFTTYLPWKGKKDVCFLTFRGQCYITGFSMLPIACLSIEPKHNTV